MDKQHAILSDIVSVQLSPKGLFKYILIEAHSDTNPTSKRLFVRGNDSLEYHAQNYDAFAQSLKKHGYKITRSKSNQALFTAKKDNQVLKMKCLGGGRIQHNQGGEKCHIYGYSKSFGRVDHKIAQKIIAESLEYKLEEITTSQEGY